MNPKHIGDSAEKPCEAWPCYLFTPDGTPWVTDRAALVSKAILAHHLVESRQRALLRRCLALLGQLEWGPLGKSLICDLKAELGES